jgi:hypothetical protein
VRPSQLWWRPSFNDLAILVALALVRMLLHTLTNGQYGFHRDELAVVDDARFLDWGYGVAIAALICLPNLLWQIHHHFISLDFLKSIHSRDVRLGRTANFCSTN